jgi:hypothetical protein
MQTVPLRPHGPTEPGAGLTQGPLVLWQQPLQLAGPHSAPASSVVAPPWHSPFWHVPPLQSLPQLPQLFGSLWVSVHVPQHWLPLGQI